MSGIQRRSLLTATGIGLTGALAGCLGGDETDAEKDETEDENGDDADDGDAGSVSGRIVVDNLDETAHTFDVLIEYDGEIQAWETRSIEDTTTFERRWSADREGFRVTARLNGGEPVNITPGNWNESDCLSVFVRITGEESMTHSSNTDPGHCGGGSDDESE